MGGQAGRRCSQRFPDSVARRLAVETRYYFYRALAKIPARFSAL